MFRKDVGKMELDVQQRQQEANWDDLTPRQKLSDFVRRHEYGVIVGSWAVAITGALRYALKDPIQSTTQKVVQARVWAQGLTVGIIIAAGILTQAQRSRVYEEEDDRGVRHLPTDHSWMDVLQKREKEKERAKSSTLSANEA
uniref:Acetyl xylan esterase, putative n=1 Tax=Ganoderma boninense TaxID=34458 RepID=A0A5K1JTV5_9APHY|nr:Acetyl xylan esterase, putative [Ganoderma boninense]